MSLRNAKASYANHPMIRYVRSLPGNYLLRREVADQLGCAHTTLSYLGRPGAPKGLGPTHTAKYGGITLNLYTPERVEQIRRYLSRTARNVPRRGRPKMWNSAENLARRRERARMYAYRARARKYSQAGDEGTASVLMRRADAVARKLGISLDRRAEYQRRECIRKFNIHNPRTKSDIAKADER